MTNPLRTLIGRLLARASPKKSRPFADWGSRVTYYQEVTADGLAVSYYPPNDDIGPYIAAGRYGRFPYPSEQAGLFDAVRCCTGRETGDWREPTLVYATARRQGWHIIEIHWKAAEPPAPAAPVSEPVEEAVTVYQVIRWSKDGNPYSGGVSTDPAQAEAMSGRMSGRRAIAEIEIYPKPVPIRYGMKLRNRP